MRKGLVDDLKTHLISVTKKYSELNETDMFYKHYRGAVSEGIFGLINTAIVLYENKLYKAAREYLDKSKKIFYNDPELHFIYAKYYLALTYTQIGYKEKAIDVYQQVVDLNDNEILTYYSQKAILCLDNPTDPTCSAIGIEVVSEPVVEEKEEPATEMGRFIESGQKIHPAAMDKITRERMDRKLQQEENIKKQLEAEQQEAQKKQFGV